VKLTKLVIHKYRNVTPGTEIDFSGQRNVFLGQNGTGKTTLLELIVMVFNSNFSQLKDDEFRLEYEFNLSAGHVWISDFGRKQSCSIARTAEPDDC
jgi:recombinational DNA repair ATPase RecF